MIVAQRPKTCTAALAVAVEGADTFVDVERGAFGSTRPGQTLIFYIAPGSSYESPDATNAAWEKAAQRESRL